MPPDPTRGEAPMTPADGVRIALPLSVPGHGTGKGKKAFTLPCVIPGLVTKGKQTNEGTASV